MNLVGRATGWSVVCWALLPVGLRAAEKPTPAAVAVEFFEKKVRPVLVEHCYKCHSIRSPKVKGGLLLDTREALLKGGDNGPAVVPGRPDKSRLLEAVGYSNVDLRMPPKGKLPDAAIADLAAWVKMGVPWPAEAAPKAAVAGKEAFDLLRRKREHWAWQPIRPQSPPDVKMQSWPRGAVDQFLLAKLEEKGLTPAAPADRRTLLRRVYFDLIGLPPSPAEVEAFVHDSSPAALERVVDRLLASSQFGERWARHWLDLVRYAETRGHEFDYPAPNAYQYRDYVIRAFNADVPYDRFVTEHIAGDLLEQPRLHPTAGFNESILGTGFWFLGEQLHSPVDIRQDEADRLDNMVDVMTKTFLGLTVSCARCHDHKFDAISTKDYYALFGFLESSSYRLARFDTREHNRQVAADLWKLRDESRAPVQRALAETMRPGVNRLADYLLTAREVMLANQDSDAKATGEAYHGLLARTAEAHKLDAGILGHWLTHLSAARKDPLDPLHAWARLAADPGSGDPKRLTALLQPLVEAGRQREAAAEAALTGTEVVVDYGKVKPEDWLPDDVTYGPGPVRPGDLRLAGGATRSVVRFVDHAAAEYDRAWERLRPSAGAEDEPGALGGTVRAGRTILTPSFQVTASKVFYLVKGSGRAYAAVDSHVMINGPLHAALVKSFAAGNGFQWIGHDLSPYKGQRAHLEFTPADGSDFAVARVVQGANAPGALDRPNHELLRMLTGEDAGSVETLAKAYQRLFADTVERLASDRIINSPEAVDYARLADWSVQRLELFHSGEGRKNSTPLGEVAGPLLAEQAKVAARIVNESRLAPAMLDGNGVDEHVFIRGAHKAPGDPAPRRLLEALAGPEPLAIAHGSGRLELARQMTDPAVNPFITRVLVNRVWHHLFGRGLVASVDNFGVLGEPSTHPELLDYLAAQFAREGWSVKRLIRSLVLSSAYRMSAQPDERCDQADPQNLLLHRMRIRRLEGEAIRDAMLVVSGRLDRRPYGPPVPVYLTPFMEGRGRPQSGPLDGDGRRSLYVAVRRNFLAPLMLAFDTPAPFSTVGRRTVSNVPAQALILLNDPFVHQQAALWARRVLSQSGSPQERINDMYLSAFARPANEVELAECLEFLNQQAKLSGTRPDDPAAWADLAHVLLNVKEFIFLN